MVCSAGAFLQEQLEHVCVWDLVLCLFDSRGVWRFISEEEKLEQNGNKKEEEEKKKKNWGWQDISGRKETTGDLQACLT